jgi:hypothetical protein
MLPLADEFQGLVARGDLTQELGVARGIQQRAVLRSRRNAGGFEVVARDQRGRIEFKLGEGEFRPAILNLLQGRRDAAPRATASQ